MEIDPTIADLIKFILGAVALYVAKGTREVISLRRQGKELREVNLVTSLTRALERAEEEETAALGRLEFRTLERDYWRNRCGSHEYLLRSNSIPFNPPNPPKEEGNG